MSVQLVYEARLFLLSTVTGVWLMLLYTGLRLLRLLLRHSELAVGLEDFFYWLYAGLAVFMLLYEQNDGRFRFYVIAGVFLGMLVCDRLVSKNLLRCLKKAGECFKITGNQVRRRGRGGHGKEVEG